VDEVVPDVDMFHPGVRLGILCASVTDLCSIPSSFASDRNHNAVLVACVDATYSASVDNKVTIPCCLEDQAMGPPPISITYPHTNFLCSPCAQSELVKVLNDFG
jgi:hypothetical protein